jgi:hypothetical protein
VLFACRLTFRTPWHGSGHKSTADHRGWVRARGVFSAALSFASAWADAKR